MDLACQLLWKTRTIGEVSDLSCHELIHVLNQGHYSLISGGANSAQLRNDLEGAGYRITPAFGHYAGSTEPMYMVHEPYENDMIALARKYKQNSILIADHGVQRMIFTLGLHKGRIKTGRGWSIATGQDSSFTQIDTSDGETVRFRLDF